MDVLAELNKRNFIRKDGNVFQFTITDEVLDEEDIKQLTTLLLAGDVVPVKMMIFVLYLPKKFAKIEVSQYADLSS